MIEDNISLYLESISTFKRTNNKCFYWNYDIVRSNISELYILNLSISIFSVTEDGAIGRNGSINSVLPVVSSSGHMEPY